MGVVEGHDSIVDEIGGGDRMGARSIPTCARFFAPWQAGTVLRPDGRTAALVGGRRRARGSHVER
jgi:hypothetical protein